MTRPIFEPSTSRTEAKLGFGSDQLFRRPAPRPALQWPQVILALGSTTAADNTWMPVPFTEYWKRNDPNDEYFTLTQTDAGDPGNDRWQLSMASPSGTEGRYILDCVVLWDEVGSAPCTGYEHLEVNFWNNSETINVCQIANDNAWSCEQSIYQRISALWDADPFWGASGNDGGVVCKPRARQTTGASRTLGGMYLKLTWYDDIGTIDDWVHDVVA